MMRRVWLLLAVLASCSDEAVVVNPRLYADTTAAKDGSLLDTGATEVPDAAVAEVSPADDVSAVDVPSSEVTATVGCSCPAGYVCMADSCVPAPSFACAPCSSDATCLGGECKAFADGKFCLIPCQIDAAGASNCPDGFACTDGRCQPG